MSLVNIIRENAMHNLICCKLTSVKKGARIYRNAPYARWLSFEWFDPAFRT